jgi:hypothetical protein
MKLNIRAFALTLGIIYGLLLFLTTWWLLAQGEVFAGKKVFLSYIYPGYKVSPLGSLLGLGYGFIDGTIVGAPFAWLYNKLSSKNGAQ